MSSFDPDLLSEMLEGLPLRGRDRRRHVRTLRGVRGLPDGEVARVLAAAWQHQPPTLPVDDDALTRLFHTAFEDGLVAIGLAAARVPDTADAALDLGLKWLERIDDSNTADALGWLLLGPAALVTHATDDLLHSTRSHAHPAVRRAGLMAAMAMTPTRLEGPAAAALRERLGQREVRFVDEALAPTLTLWANTFLRDDATEVRKALRRVLRAWGTTDPSGLTAWADTVRGGLPKMLKPEVEKARRTMAARSK